MNFYKIINNHKNKYKRCLNKLIQMAMDKSIKNNSLNYLKTIFKHWILLNLKLFYKKRKNNEIIFGVKWWLLEIKMILKEKKELLLKYLLKRRLKQFCLILFIFLYIIKFMYNIKKIGNDLAWLYHILFIYFMIRIVSMNLSILLCCSKFGQLNLDL